MADYNAYIYCPCGTGGEVLAAEIAGGTVATFGADGESDLGVDIACIADINPEFTLATGLVNVGMAMLRRLTTPRGGLFYDEDYGFDVRSYLSAGLNAEELHSLPSSIQAECLKDERIQEATARLTYYRGEQRAKITVLAETAEGPFRLVLSAAGLTPELLSAGLAQPAL